MENISQASSAEQTMERHFSLSNTLLNDSLNQHLPKIYSIEDCESINMTYGPCLPHAPTLTQSAISRALVLSIMAFWSLLGNFMTLLSAGRSRRTQFGISRIYALIVQLAIADLFVTVFCMIGEGIWLLTVDWRGGDFGCKGFKFIQMFSLYLSTFIMLLIGIDRLVSVKYPLKALSKDVCSRLIWLCWITAAILSLPQLYVFRVAKGPFLETFTQCVSFGAYSSVWQEQFYAIFSISTMFFIPLIILVLTYVLTVSTLHQMISCTRKSHPNDTLRMVLTIFQGILWVSTFMYLISSRKFFLFGSESALSQVQVFRARFDERRQKIIHRAKIKSLRLSITIIVTFIICWLPYYIMMIISIFFEIKNFGLELETAEEEDQNPIPGIFAWNIFGMSNSLFNPIIYGIFLLWRPKSDNGQLNRVDEPTCNYNTRDRSLVPRNFPNHLVSSRAHHNYNHHHRPNPHYNYNNRSHQFQFHTQQDQTEEGSIDRNIGLIRGVHRARSDPNTLQLSVSNTRSSSVLNNHICLSTTSQKGGGVGSNDEIVALNLNDLSLATSSLNSLTVNPIEIEEFLDKNQKRSKTCLELKRVCVFGLKESSSVSSSNQNQSQSQGKILNLQRNSNSKRADTNRNQHNQDSITERRNEGYELEDENSV